MNIEPLLAVTRHLAAPFDLLTMLEEVVGAAKAVLDAERGSVWLYDGAAHELVLRVSTDLKEVRVPADAGLVGSCAQGRQIINVRDCYADPRFNPEMDRRTHYRTRCMLTLPLIDHKDHLVGVLQVLNKVDGVFDDADEALASSLAAQCAVALQRARMTEELIESEKMRRELEMARLVQMSILPATMPAVPGYAIHGASHPADLTGGDTFDVGKIGTAGTAGEGVLLVLGDATGHGLAPALHVTQMHSMLRMAMRLGTDLDTAVFHLNNQLGAHLPDDRFITAFIGVLAPASHTVRYHSAGQAPILHLADASGHWESYRPTGMPLAAMPAAAPRPSRTLAMAPGDLLVLLSDGIYEFHDAHGEMYGEARVRAFFSAHRFTPLPRLGDLLLEDVKRFAGNAPQEDDITLLLLQRERPRAEESFPREIAALDAVFGFIQATFAAQGVPREVLHDIEFTVEELFTNMVKYSTMSRERIDVAVSGGPAGVEVTLTDHGIDAFDVTRAPDVDVGLPIDQRRPGGLGLHLIRRIVDGIEYAYDAATRTSRTRFHKTVVTP